MIDCKVSLSLVEIFKCQSKFQFVCLTATLGLVVIGDEE